jgi:hypothetical protein
MVAVAIFAVIGVGIAIWSRAEIPTRTLELEPLLEVSGKAVADEVLVFGLGMRCAPDAASESTSRRCVAPPGAASKVLGA